ncbi:hypothetical protein Lal_00042883 [Lupinus albus]|nr:hypothetical protein Lal_00042883 [Lupinus albus]
MNHNSKGRVSMVSHTLRRDPIHPKTSLKGRKRVRITRFTSSQASRYFPRVVAPKITSFSILSQVLTLNLFEGFYFKVKSSGSRSSEPILAQARKPRLFKISDLALSLKRESHSLYRFQNATSRSGATTLAQARPLSLRRDHSRSGENPSVWPSISLTQDLKKRFTHLTNHLIALGKVLSNCDLNLKVLRSLERTWQPKVTVISEKKNLSKMSLEHELELSQLDQHEEQEKKKKNISLKARVEKYESSEDEDDKEETDDMILFVKKFRKFLRRNKGRRTGQIKKFSKSNEASTSN